MKVGVTLIEQFWNICLLHDIITRDQLLREAVRVVKTKQLIQQQPRNQQPDPDDPEQLFQWMKTNVGERELGHFPGDRELFFKLFHLGKDLDLLDYAMQTLQQDRVIGTMLVDSSIVESFWSICREKKHKILMIAEAEKFLRGLGELSDAAENRQIILLTENYILGRLLGTYFNDQPHIRIIQGSIYQPLPLQQKFDAILTVPNFGMKVEDQDDQEIRESEGAALEHLLPLLEKEGSLLTVLPAKMLFQSGPIGKWRKRLREQAEVESIHMLPEGLFRPYTSVKTYQIVFHKAPIKVVKIGQLHLQKDVLVVERDKSLPIEAFQELEDWRIDWLLDENYQTLQAYQTASIPKVKLREVADIFRGKSILKQDLKPGSVKVLNISNIEDGEVILDQLETIHEEERKVKRYEILPGDLVMTCRGTVTKIAVFPEQNDLVIASANIIVIRFKQLIRSDYAKIFLESPLGLSLIQSFQRGTTVININPSDVAELELPLLPMEKQAVLIEKYRQEKVRYKKAIREATQRWQQEKERIFSQLY